MKRIKDIYEKICSVENLNLADMRARKGKLHSYGVMLHDRHREENIHSLHDSLINKTFRTSKYHIFTIYEPKERQIYQLPYFPDRILHHAIMNIMEPIWLSIFTKDTYSCIKGRGIHGIVRRLKEELKDTRRTQFCLKIDVRKFYPSIDHEILKTILRMKIKDKDLLWLLDEIIESAPGVPIGNYLSQFFANLYLAYFDHWIKEEKKVRYYYRYADDIVVLSDNKESLHALLRDINEYLESKLKLVVKGNYQVFPIDARGIDFVGYRFYHTHALLRKSIKQSFARAVKRSRNCRKQVHAAYWGWAKHCNSKHFIEKLETEMNAFKDLGINTHVENFAGDKVKISKILNRDIVITNYRIQPSKYPKNKSGKCLHLQIEIDGEKKVIFTGSDVLIHTMEQVKKESLPIACQIIQEGESFEFK